MAKKVIRFLGLPEKYHGLRVEWLLLTVLIIAACFTGCNGCDCGCDCLNVDVKPQHKSGSVIITVNNLIALATPGETKMISVTYSGNVTSSDKDFGDQSFSVNRNYEVTVTGVTPQPVYDRINLRPGTWNITVSAGTWSKTQSTTFGEGQSQSLTFTYGQ